MATSQKKPLVKQIATKQVTSLVKKDLSAIRSHADRLAKFLKTPGAAAIRVCECCINVD